MYCVNGKSYISKILNKTVIKKSPRGWRSPGHPLPIDPPLNVMVISAGK